MQSYSKKTLWNAKIGFPDNPPQAGLMSQTILPKLASCQSASRSRCGKGELLLTREPLRANAVKGKPLPGCSAHALGQVVTGSWAVGAAQAARR